MPCPIFSSEKYVAINDLPHISELINTLTPESGSGYSQFMTPDHIHQGVGNLRRPHTKSFGLNKRIVDDHTVTTVFVTD